MRILHALMRAYAYLYHFILAALLAGIALVAYLTGVHNINTGGMTTIAGKDLSQLLLGMGILGMVLVILAILGIARWLFPLYAIGIAILMFRWLFMSPYSFSGGGEFRGAILLFLGAFLAMLFSFLEFRSRRNRRR